MATWYFPTTLDIRRGKPMEEKPDLDNIEKVATWTSCRCARLGVQADQKVFHHNTAKYSAGPAPTPALT